MVLTEETYFDEKGFATNNSFTDYKMLGASDMPKMTSILVENPDPYGPFGAKSVGEAADVATLALSKYHPSIPDSLFEFVYLSQGRETG